MRISSLKIENFKSISKIEISNLPNFLVIVGANGIGKTSIFDAITFVKSHIGPYSHQERNWWQQKILLQNPVKVGESKMKKYSIIIISTFLFGFILIACGASSELSIEKPLETKLNQYSIFIFSAESSVAEDVKEEIIVLEKAVMDRVKDLNLFNSTVFGYGKNANEESLIVRAVITEINKVSGLSRLLIGAFAGSASMTIDVSFIDAKTGNSIAEFNITGESGSTGYSGGTSEAIEMTAEKIAEVISENFE